MSKFNLKGFMDCNHEFALMITKFGATGVESKEVCTRCGMDRRMEQPVNQLIEVEDERRKREGASREEQTRKEEVSEGIKAANSSVPTSHETMA